MSTKHKGDTGGTLGGRMDMSPTRRRKRRAARAQEERQWAARSGPVTTKKAVPDSRQAISGTAHETPINSKEFAMQQPINTNSTPPRGFHTIPGDDDANPAVYVGHWIQTHGLDVAVEWSRERGLEIRDGEGAPMTTQQVEVLIQRLHQLIGAFKVASTGLEQRGEGGDK